MMNVKPENIILVKVEAIVMPSGEILCMGKSIGFIDKIGKIVTPYMDATTGEPVEENTYVK